MSIQSGLEHVKPEFYSDYHQKESYGYKPFSRDAVGLPWETQSDSTLESKNINSNTCCYDQAQDDVDETRYPQKHSQITATLKWLNDNYEKSEGVCLPRCVLYTHYLDFCKTFTFNPAGAATFGKIIRQKFPKLTTRRLGTRGQSKYHYYGIGIKESSIYYHSVYSGKGLTRFSGTKMKTEGSNRKYSLSSKTGTLLPEFPDVNNLIIPSGIDPYKMKTFLLMYRTHCQRILDTVIGANFEEVESLLLHFWQGMPDHLIELLDGSLAADIIALCDSILYKVLVDVIIPSSIQELPESLGRDIHTFIRKIPIWLRVSLEETPPHIQKIKEEVCHSFIQSVKRHLSFVHLAQTTRGVLSNADSVNSMIEDIADVSLTEISGQAVFLKPDEHSQREIIFDSFDEFQTLLTKQSTVECFTEWMDELIDKCVLQFPKSKNGVFNEIKAADFLLQWCLVGSLIMRDLTLHSASSFGSFHLLHMMLDEYAFLVLETQNELVRDQLLQTNLQKHMKTAEVIKMSARIRSSSIQNNSPKIKKRKESGLDNSGNDSVNTKETEKVGDNNSRLSHTQGNVAFIRPLPVASQQETPYYHSSDIYRTGYNTSTSEPPYSSMKHYHDFNGGGYERSYIAGNYSYPDFVNNNSSFPPHKIMSAGYDESHSHGQRFTSFPSLSRTLSPADHCYWSESRSLPVVNHPVSQYSYHGSIDAGFDHYKTPGYSRSRFCQDAVGSSFPMAAFNPCVHTSQYSLSNQPVYQDEYYTSYGNQSATSCQTNGKSVT